MATGRAASAEELRQGFEEALGLVLSGEATAVTIIAVMRPKGGNRDDRGIRTWWAGALDATARAMYAVGDRRLRVTIDPESGTPETLESVAPQEDAARAKLGA